MHNFGKRVDAWSLLTVEDAWARGLPPGTTLVGGASGLGRRLTWVTVLRGHAPGFVGLRGGELALVSQRVLRDLDGRLTLPDVICRLADATLVIVRQATEVAPPTMGDAVHLRYDSGDAHEFDAATGDRIA